MDIFSIFSRERTFSRDLFQEFKADVPLKHLEGSLGTCRQEHWESFSQCQISVENLNEVSEREKYLRKRGDGEIPGGRKSC